MCTHEYDLLSHLFFRTAAMKLQRRVAPRITNFAVLKAPKGSRPLVTLLGS